MNIIYKIEVNLYPNNKKNESKPFFWCIKSCADKNWCLVTAGWESSHQAAWVSAYQFYLKYKKDK